MGNIKGITIEFRGDTTPLQKAINEVRKSGKDLDRELSQVNRSLKFNPTNVDLWRQKQTLLNQKIDQTEKDLKELKNAEKQLKNQGVDENSKEFRELQREIIKTENKLKSARAELRKIGNAKLQALGQQFKQVGAKMQAIGRNMSMYVTGPLVAVGTLSAKNFAEVDKTMQLTNKTMGNTEEQAKLLDAAMKSAASNSTYGMNEAATATLNFARAGLYAEEAAAALAPAMNLAAGEGGNLDTVSAGLVATINGFGDSFDKAADYADVFANACNNSALDIDSLSEAMSIAAPIFSSAGYSVQDAALYMGAMANAGIPASEAANALKTGMARLVSPAKAGAEAMEQYGISITNSDGSMKDTITLQKELHDTFSGLSEAEKISAASAIFGKNQMSKWLALINTAPEDINALSESLMVEGTTTEMASAMMSGFGGSIEKLKSSVDVASASLGQALAPIILKVAEVIQKAVDWFNSLSESQQRVIAVVGVVVAAIGPLLVILGVLVSTIGNIMIFGPMIIGAIGAVVAAFGPVIAIIAGVIAAGVLLYKNWDKITAKTREMVANVTKFIDNLKTQIAAKFTAIKTAVTNAWNTIKTATANAWNAIKDKMITPIKTAYEKVKGIIDKVKSFFPIKVGNLLKGLKLPHFKLTGKFSLKPPSVPKLDIDWYKTGGIFDSPTMIGIGEAGAEAVVPLDKFWDKMDKIAEGSGGVTINVYGAEGQSAREIAEEVKRALIRETKQRRLAW